MEDVYNQELGPLITEVIYAQHIECLLHITRTYNTCEHNSSGLLLSRDSTVLWAKCARSSTNTQPGLCSEAHGPLIPAVEQAYAWLDDDRRPTLL